MFTLAAASALLSSLGDCLAPGGASVQKSPRLTERGGVSSGPYNARLYIRFYLSISYIFRAYGSVVECLLRIS